MRALNFFIAMAILMILSGSTVAQAGTPEVPTRVYSQDGDLFTVAIFTGEVEQLTTTPDIFEYEPVWSPDGTQIAYTMYYPDDSDLPREIRLRTLGTDDEVVACTQCSNPLWSPDGTKLVYMQSVDNPESHTWGSWMMSDLSTSETQTLLTADIWVDGWYGDWVDDRFVVQYYDVATDGYRFQVFMQDGTLIHNAPLSLIEGSDYDIDLGHDHEVGAYNWVYIYCREHHGVAACLKPFAIWIEAQQVLEDYEDLSSLFVPPEFSELS